MKFCSLQEIRTWWFKSQPSYRDDDIHCSKISAAQNRPWWQKLLNLIWWRWAKSGKNIFMNAKQCRQLFSPILNTPRIKKSKNIGSGRRLKSAKFSQCLQTWEKSSNTQLDIKQLLDPEVVKKLSIWIPSTKIQTNIVMKTAEPKKSRNKPSSNLIK